MRFFLFLSLALSPLFLTGCNTFKGVGEDISGAASWTQDKMSGTDASSSAKSSDSQYVQNPPQFPKNN